MAYSTLRRRPTMTLASAVFHGLSHLPAGTPLLLHQEKTNPVDPNAVEVLSLHGESASARYHCSG